MRIIFAGTPDTAAVSLRRLLASEHEIVAVLTRPDARRGRGRTRYPSPVKAVALEHGIEVIEASRLSGDSPEAHAARERLRALRPAAIPVVAYGALIPADLLTLPEHGWINLHFSLLPRWRGAAPVQAALRAGDEVTGVTVFRIDEGLDTGDVLAAHETRITGNETAADLLGRLADAGSDLLVSVLDQLAAGTIHARPQTGDATHVGKLTVEDARLNWELPARELAHAVRAFTPAPGAWTSWQDKRIKIGAARAEAPSGLLPGRVSFSKSEMRVGTGEGDLVVLRVQPPGKKMMEAAAWGRGLRVDTEMRFV